MCTACAPRVHRVRAWQSSCSGFSLRRLWATACGHWREKWIYLTSSTTTRTLGGAPYGDAGATLTKARSRTWHEPLSPNIGANLMLLLNGLPPIASMSTEEEELTRMEVAASVENT